MRKQLADQSAHAAAAILGLLPFALLPCAITGAWAGLCMGLIREVTEQDRPVSLDQVRRALKRSPLDLSFWTLGGLLVGLAA